MIPIKGQWWECPKYESLVKLFENVKTTNRNMLYDKFVCKNVVSDEWKIKCIKVNPCFPFCIKTIAAEWFI